MRDAQADDAGWGSAANHLQAYSALQCLLVFQSLAAHRPESDAFEQVSGSLKKSGFFAHENATSSDLLLNPESLRNLYATTLRTNAEGAISDQPHLANGDASTAKDKSTDTGAHDFNAAVLIRTLYEDYKRRIIDDIRAEERKYDQIIEQIKSIQTNAEQDVKPRFAPDVVPAGSGGSQGELLPTETEVRKSLENSQPPSDDKPHDTTFKPSEDTAAVHDVSPPRRANASIDSIINHDEPPDGNLARPSTADSGAASTPTLPRDLPYAPAAQPIVPPMPAGSSPLRQESRSAHDLHQAPSPRPTAPLSHVSSPASPIVLPPPPGLTAFPPTTPYSPTANNASSSAYRRPPPHYSGPPYIPQDPYTSTRYAEPYPRSHQAQREKHRPSSSGQTQQRPNVPQYQPQSPFYPAGAPSQYGHRGGVMLPPFQVSSQTPGSTQVPQLSRPIPEHPTTLQQQQQQSSDIPERAHRYNAAYPSAPFQTPTLTGVLTPVSARNALHFREPGVTLSPVSATRWKIFPSAQDKERSPPRSVSPVSDKEATPIPSKTIGGGRGRKSKAAKAAQATLSLSARQTSHGRSQSVSSHVSESVGSALPGKGARRIKNEMPSTPATAFPPKDNDTETGGTVKSVKRVQSMKRKHGNSDTRQEAATPKETPIAPLTMRAPDTVLAYRNFSRMAQPVMNIIASHKHASIFAEPVRERQAEGYRDIIKRPQDLKSIRAAIGAGSRAVAAAVDTQQSTPSSVSGSSSSNAIILPVSEAIIPPKGIVNAAQLEQEIMRMFANAVMFNPGEDEIVKDTREMFASVEQALQQWRDVERMDEADEVPREEEDPGGGSAKRRRV